MPTGRGTRIERAEQHASDAPKPALVLDIDGTSLSNWPAILTSDYAFIKKGTCDPLEQQKSSGSSGSPQTDAPRAPGGSLGALPDPRRSRAALSPRGSHRDNV